MGDNIMQADISVITRKVIVPMILITLLAISVPAIISWCVLQFSGKVV
jgi:hypothetical protein